jgi:hypothetical protein
MSSSEAGRSSHSDESQEKCAHKRIIDDERSENGEQTGNIICKECGAVVSAKNDPPE